MDVRMDAAALQRFLDEQFPQTGALGFRIETLDDAQLVLRMEADARHLRPGGTVSGPVLMTLADSAVYLLVLSRLGPVALAVTTNLNIHFMRKPRPGPILATGTLLKLGKRIAVGEVRLHGLQPAELYAHATVTYSIPPSA